jgi:hypothetical protein
LSNLDSMLHRYPRLNYFTTAMNVDQDLLDLIQGLTSQAVVSDILHERHGFSDRRKICAAARMLVDYVRQGLRFVEQARMGPRVVSFLPWYYAFLQFAKAVIVARRGAAGLQGAITHGLSYRESTKDSYSLTGDEIYVWGGGVFPVFYEVLTGQTLPDLRRIAKRSTRSPMISIRMKNVYPYVPDASFEYDCASGIRGNNFQDILIDKDFDSNSRLKLTLRIRDKSGVDVNVSPLFRKLGVEGKPVILPKGTDLYTAIPAYLLYHPITVQINPLLKQPFWYSTPQWSGRLRYPEEIPLFLAFFHLGSVVRYKPRFMERIMDSAYYPFILALERHAVTKTFLLFYDSIMQCTHLIEGR